MATKAQPGFDIVSVTLIELVGVALFAILAGMSDNMGKVMLVIMWGIVLGWALLHVSELSSLVKAI
jgi:hypothetical protein